VPLDHGRVTDDFRIRSALPTIDHCLNQGAGVVLMFHLGRPKGKVDKNLSLIPVGESLADLLEMPIKFSDDCVSEDARDTSLGISNGEVHLLENLRFYEEETANDLHFSMLLSKHGDVFINDAFGTAHRAHASNVGIVSHFKQKGMGLLMEKEYRFLKESFDHPNRPVTLILGGAKIDTKLSLINRFLNKADTILIGGGMAFTFLKANGKEVGNSLVDDGMIESAHQIIQSSKESNVKIVLPLDFVCAKKIDGKSEGVFSNRNIPSDMMGLDIGPKTISIFKQYIDQSNTILWNGPMGVFENEDFATGSKELAATLAEVTEKGATTIVGGGDTAAAIRTFRFQNDVSHVSTGGGASLELLSGEFLPAFKALELR
jgi:3-phosphoglycerate kinase